MSRSRHSTRKTGLYRQAARAWREQLKTHWRWIASLELPLIGVAVLMAFWPVGPRLLLAFSGGLLLGGGIACAVGFLVLTSYPVTVGWWAETQTSNLLTALGSEWRIIDDIEFEHRNVDHVAITLAGILVVETKYQGPAHGRIDPQQHQRHVEQAERSARSIRALLHSKGMDRETTVMAALVIWGPGTPQIDGGWRRERSVDVVQGSDPGTWAAQFEAGNTSAQTARSLHQVFLDFQQERDTYAQQQPVVEGP